MDQLNQTKPSVKKWIGVGVIAVAIIGLGMWYFGGEKVPKKTPAQIAAEERANYEREEIVAAILNQQKILASKDVKKIRAYYVGLAVTPEDQKSFAKMTDAKFLEMAASSARFAVGLTAEELKSDKTTWSVAPNIAIVKLQRDAANAVMFTIQKINGAWY